MHIQASAALDVEYSMSDSILRKESMQVIAQHNGIQALGDDVAQAILSDMEYRVREVVQEAMKFMRHSKRQRLCCTDVDSALKLKNVEVCARRPRPLARRRPLPAHC